MSPRVAALLPLLACLPPALAGCARGERYGASESSGQITGASLGVSDGDTEDGDTDESEGSGASASVSGTGPWTSGSASTTAPPTTGDPSWSAGDPSTTDATTWDPSATATTTGDATSTGDPGCDGPCDAPPGPCHAAIGACVDGTCEYAPKDAGAPCDDGDGCTTADACDGDGGCGGLPVECARPNATGGTCQDGACQGWACEDPYENCDGDWDNGCEVPTGVANQCDAGGLNPDGGCWTAYCGQSAAPGTKNFAGYYCVHCSNCHVNGDQVQWCDKSTGTWFPPGDGGCGMWLDLVCPAP